MTWFVIACILGYLAYWLWAEYETEPFAIRARAILNATIIFFIAVFAWAVFVEQRHSPSLILDAMGQGHLARFLFGSLLGFYLAHINAARVPSSAPPATAPATEPETTADLSRAQPRPESPPKSVEASPLAAPAVALSMIALAIVAPHVDRWLNHVTSIKSSVVELQVSKEPLNRVAIARDAGRVLPLTALNYLEAYHERLLNDISYIELIELPELLSAKSQSRSVEAIEAYRQKSEQVERTKRLVPVFRDLIAPIAKCLKNPMNTSLGLVTLQQIVRPAANEMHQIIAKSATAEDGSHAQFWLNVLKVPEQLRRLQKPASDECEKAAVDYVALHGDMSVRGHYPRLADYAELPYLHVAAALLMAFVGETEVAMGIVNRADKHVVQKDYAYYQLQAKLRYWTGQQADAATASFEVMRRVARERWAVLRKKLDSNTASNPSERIELEKLIAREWLAELVAVNGTAYFIANDMARDLDSAKAMMATAERYAYRLKDIVDDRNESKKLPVDTVLAFKDTYAYTLLVVEAHKHAPSPQMFKAMANVLRDVVEERQQQFNQTKERLAYEELDTVRIHYASARELAGE